MKTKLSTIRKSIADANLIEENRYLKNSLINSKKSRLRLISDIRYLANILFKLNYDLKQNIAVFSNQQKRNNTRILKISRQLNNSLIQLKLVSRKDSGKNAKQGNITNILRLKTRDNLYKIKT